MNKEDTMKIDVNELKQREEVIENINLIYNALVEKGYDPKGQLIGYIMTGDPTYITSHNNARAIAGRLDRYEILEIILEDYFSKH